MSTIRIYSPEGSLPHTEAVAYANAESHIQANDQHAGEAAVLIAYHTGRGWKHWSETDFGVTDGGISWADWEYDHRAAKRSIQRGWETEATFGSKFPDEDGLGACDVEVQVGECGGRWYIRTNDDAGGSDDCDATSYDSEADARSAAREYAQENDECDGLSAADWLVGQEESLINSGKAGR